MNSPQKEIVTLINEYTKKASELYQDSVQPTALTPKMDIFNTELRIFALYLSDINAFICLGAEERTRIMSDIMDQLICDENTEALFNYRANMYHSLSQNNQINNIPHSWLYSEMDFPKDDLLLKLTVLLTDVISIDTLYGSFTTDEKLKQLHMFDITFSMSMMIFCTEAKKITIDFFKKCHDLFRPPKKRDLVLSAYETFKPELVSSFIPNGISQARLIASSLSKITNLDLECCTPQQCLELLKIYIDVSIRTRITSSAISAIVKSLLANHSELIKNEDLAISVVTYCQINAINPLFALNDDKSMLTLNSLSTENKKNIKICYSNTRLVNENTSDEDYGYVKSNPIYTNGIEGSKKYLAKLRTTEGKKLNWKRLGSTSDKNIDGMIDIYSGTLPSGESCATLYLNMYSNVSSQKAPKGFVFCSIQSNSDMETNKLLNENEFCNASGNTGKISEKPRERFADIKNKYFIIILLCLVCAAVITFIVVYQSNLSSVPRSTTSPAEAEYIGNANSMKFHEPLCDHLPDKLNRIYYRERKEAINDRMIPCKICDP